MFFIWSHGPITKMCSNVTQTSLDLLIMIKWEKKQALFDAERLKNQLNKFSYHFCNSLFISYQEGLKGRFELPSSHT